MMSNNGTDITFANCSALASRKDFAKYIKEIEDSTQFVPELLISCKSNICIALWGDGNADISGIGMITGYLFESILGILIAIALLALSPTFTGKPPSRITNILDETSQMFFHCAAFFAASIEISCLVVLARRDFAISANGLGGLTVQITWAVALLCMLSLLYPMVILNFTDSKRSGYRLFLFSGCWLLFFYTFVSRMIGDFAPSQVGSKAGEGDTTIVSVANWAKVTDMCLGDVNILSDLEQKILSGFGAAGSILISVYGLGSLLWFIINRRSTKATSSIEKRFAFGEGDARRGRKIALGVVILVFSLTIPQIWGIFRLRDVQRQLSDASGNVYTDNQWTFGQVVAVMLFAPVITEMGYLWLGGN